MSGHVALEHLAYGAFTHPSVAGEAHIGLRAGDRVLDLTALARHDDRTYADLVAGPVLNPLLAAGPTVWAQVLADASSRLASSPIDLLPIEEVTPQLPFEVADYVDFYSSEQHATNVGHIFRPDSNPLTPNWKHLPIGYHGRAGTVVVSGTPVVRPCGQRKAPADPAPTYGPSQRLDIEAEVGFVVGVGTSLGRRVSISDLAEHVFGVVLLNDWSARDLQSWEYVPLGPFLGKSFATSISAWVVPLTSLLHARVAPPPRDPPLLDYLVDDEPWGLDLAITVTLNGHVISSPSFASMYWTAAQQLAHLTVNGASLRTGDLFGSGTVSDPVSFGSLLELSWNGRDQVAVGDETRTFLADGDEVVLTASAPGPDGTRVELGEVRGRIAPARD